MRLPLPQGLKNSKFWHSIHKNKSLDESLTSESVQGLETVAEIHSGSLSILKQHATKRRLALSDACRKDNNLARLLSDGSECLDNITIGKWLHQIFGAENSSVTIKPYTIIDVKNPYQAINEVLHNTPETHRCHIYTRLASKNSSEAALPWMTLEPIAGSDGVFKALSSKGTKTIKINNYNFNFISQEFFVISSPVTECESPAATIQRSPLPNKSNSAAQWSAFLADT